MSEQRARIVCYVNQFFGQIGGEEHASVGFIVKEGTVGSSALFQMLLGDIGDVVSTVICGDNYFADNPENAIVEGLKIIAGFKPDLFIAGPSFNAGRYGLNCGAIASAVAETLKIPVITGMYHESPAAEMYRKDIYIIKTGIHARGISVAAEKMASLGRKLLLNEPVKSAKDEGYIIRDRLFNEFIDSPAYKRAIDMLLLKIKGEPFETEMKLPVFKEVVSPMPIENIGKAKIALISDGGLVPAGNPDGMKSFSSTSWGKYNLNKLFEEPHDIVHGGYDHTAILENMNRLIPKDVMEQLKKEGKIGELAESVYMTSGNCMSIAVAEQIGTQIASQLLEEGVSAAILTST